MGLSGDGMGNLYIADARNNTIFKLALATGIVTRPPTRRVPTHMGIRVTNARMIQSSQSST